jgi:NAD-dependent dihydropyrimidine dehydrogenase PreA subunit
MPPQKCGECEEACPQHLLIRENLEKVAEEFEGWWLTPTAWLVKRMMSFLKWKDVRRAKS